MPVDEHSETGVLLDALIHDLRTPLSAMSGWLEVLEAHFGEVDGIVGRALPGLRRGVEGQTQTLNGISDVLTKQRVELPEEETRHLFLFYREALHNIMRHAKATKVEINVNRLDGHFQIDIADDGLGIAPERLERPATLRALRQRTSALGAELKVDTRPGEGTRLTLIIPITRKRAKKLRETTTPAE